MKARIAMTDVEIKYPRTDPVLTFRQLEMDPGNVTAVTGRTGSGKSTLGHAAAGLLPFSGARIKGSLHIGNITVPLGDRKSWQGIRGKSVRWIPQEPARAFTPTRHILPQMIEGIDDPQAYSGKLKRLLEVTELPNADTLMRLYPFEMSGGMLQRAAVISAFLPGPALVVADEPTAHLDPSRGLILAHIITALAKHASSTVLWITHDLRLAAALADRVIFLSEGRIEADGPPQDLLNPFGEKPLPLVQACARLALPV